VLVVYLWVARVEWGSKFCGRKKSWSGRQGKFYAKFENGIIELDLTVSSLLDDYVDSTRVLRSPEICADSAGGSLEKSKGEGSNRFKKWPVSS
jgi:hypothetical protein